MIVRKLETSVKESREKEDMQAKIEKQAALIEYLAIMADIDLEEEEGEGDHE